MPFYGHEATPGGTSFLSLPWMDVQTRTERTRGVPAALSWHTRKPAGDTSLTLLLGLYRDATSANDERRGHLFPLYAYRPTYAISPLYACSDSDTRLLRVIPPMLSWQSRAPPPVPRAFTPLAASTTAAAAAKASTPGRIATGCSRSSIVTKRTAP